MSATEPLDPDARIVVESRRHVLFEDDDGFAIWAIDRDDDEPIATFPPSDDGLDEAMARWESIARHERRGRLLTALAVVAGLIGVTYVGLAVSFLVLAVVVSLSDPRQVSAGFERFITLFGYPLAQVLPTAFLASVGIYAVLWMEFRRGERRALPTPPRPARSPRSDT